MKKTETKKKYTRPNFDILEMTEEDVIVTSDKPIELPVIPASLDYDDPRYNY